MKKMKALYQSCLDTDTIDEMGAEPVIELIGATGESQDYILCIGTVYVHLNSCG